MAPGAVWSTLMTLVIKEYFLSTYWHSCRGAKTEHMKAMLHICDKVKGHCLMRGLT